MPQLDDVPVDSSVVIGPSGEKPLRLDIPIFVSDMSFGALSAEAKIALAKGRNWPALAPVRVRVACYPKNKLPTQSIFTNWPLGVLVTALTR